MKKRHKPMRKRDPNVPSTPIVDNETRRCIAALNEFAQRYPSLARRMTWGDLVKIVQQLEHARTMEIFDKIDPSHKPMTEYLETKDTRQTQ